MGLEQYKTGEHSISKDDAVEKLKEMGYNAFLDKGVVCITRPAEENTEYSHARLFEKLRSDARGIGYFSSIGIAPVIN